MRVVGIDPGLATIGIGVIEAPSPDTLSVVEWLTLETPAGLPLAERLQEILRDLRKFLAETKPDLAVVEKLFFSTNERTAFDVAHARGVILLAVAEHGIPLLEPTPGELKSCITGDGAADKRQIQEMLVRMLKLNDVPKPDDAADALALAAYGALQQQKVHLLA